MNPNGRPSSYTRPIADRICDRLAAGESLRSICSDDDMPDRQTVMRWVMNEIDEFHIRYARARELGLDEIADQLFEISDDGRNDWMEKIGRNDETIGYMVNGEAVQRSKLRVDTRKWYLAKLAPKRYGDKQEVALSNPDGSPLKLDETAAAARLASLLALAQARKEAGQLPNDDISDLL